MGIVAFAWNMIHPWVMEFLLFNNSMATTCLSCGLFLTFLDFSVKSYTLTSKEHGEAVHKKGTGPLPEHIFGHFHFQFLSIP